MEALWQFIERCCVEQGIDESHGIKHSRGCVAWVEKLLLAEVEVTDEERQLAIYSAALHDMCDKKYTDVDLGLTKIREWLLSQGWSLELSGALVDIINTTSYSKLKRMVVDGRNVFPDHGIWNRVYHIVRHADLLDAYQVGRCYLYQKHVSPNILEEECWAVVKALFDVRVFPYISEGWISLPKAVEFAKELELVARQSIADRKFIY